MKLRQSVGIVFWSFAALAFLWTATYWGYHRHWGQAAFWMGFACFAEITATARCLAALIRKEIA